MLPSSYAPDREAGPKPALVWAALALCAALSVTLRLAFLNEPFERDEGFYSAIGLRILEGGVPYRDGIEQKGPLLFYLYALGMAVFGQSMAAIRVFTAVYNVITLLGVYALAREVSGRRAGLGAAAIFAVFSSVPLMQAASSNAEVFLVLPLVWGAVYVMRWMRTNRPGYLVGAGIASIAALLIKLVAAPFSLLMLVAVAWHGWRSGRLVGSLMRFLAPQAAIAAAVVAYFAGVGALRDFIQFTILVPFLYAKAEGVSVSGPPLKVVLPYLADELMPISVLALPVILVLPWFRRDPPALYLAALPATAAAAVLLPGKNFPHYFINLVPFFSAATAVAIAELVRARPLALKLVPILPAVLLANFIAKEHTLYWKVSPDDVSRIKYGEEFVFTRDLGVYLRNRTQPGDYVFQWGFEPQLYLISGRRIPSRFISSTGVPAVPDQLAARQELARDLLRSRPVYVVVFDQWGGLPGHDVVRDFLRSQGYRLETRYPSAFVFRRPG